MNTIDPTDDLFGEDELDVGSGDDGDTSKWSDEQHGATTQHSDYANMSSSDFEKALAAALAGQGFESEALDALGRSAEREEAAAAEKAQAAAEKAATARDREISSFLDVIRQSNDAADARIAAAREAQIGNAPEAPPMDFGTLTPEQFAAVLESARTGQVPEEAPHDADVRARLRVLVGGTE